MNQSSLPPDFTTLSDFRPYMLRACHAWLSDNNQVPYILVDATAPGVKVPASAVKNGMVVLNINMQAVINLQLGDTHISFGARFGGRPEKIEVPMYAIRRIYARDVPVGIDFPPSPMGPPTEDIVSPTEPRLTDAQRKVLDRPLSPVQSDASASPNVTSAQSPPPPRKPWTPTLVRNDPPSEN